MRKTVPSTSMWVPFLNWLVLITARKASRDQAVSLSSSRLKEGTEMCRMTRIAILAAACAALTIIPAAAMGKGVKFQGPLDQPFIPSPNGFATDMPSIEIKVGFDGKKPTVVKKLKVRGIYGPCDASNGCTPTCVTNGVCEPP